MSEETKSLFTFLHPAWPLAVLAASGLACWIIDQFLTGPNAPGNEPLVPWNPNENEVPISLPFNVLYRLACFREALLAREFDRDSPSLRDLLDDAQICIDGYAKSWEVRRIAS